MPLGLLALPQLSSLVTTWVLPPAALLVAPQY